MIMNVNGVLSFFFCMIEVVFIPLANPKEAPNTYVLRNGVANISFEIDKKVVGGYYVDVFNPRKKMIFQGLGSNPENVHEEFKGKIKLSDDYKIGTIFFSVLNATEEDAGIYRSVIEMRGEEVGRQLLVVFTLGSCVMSCINGICNNVMGEIKCNCMKGWTGFNCSTEIDECSSNPCHSGTCYNFRYGEYLCVCNPGWTGKQCELDIDECAGSPCVNGGKCKDLVNDYICHCIPGWTGKTCEIATNDCFAEPGVNGRCHMKLNSTNGYYCVCKDGWSGTNCNIYANGNLISLIAGVIGAACVITVVILLIFGISYRRLITSVHMVHISPAMSSENAV